MRPVATDEYGILVFDVAISDKTSTFYSCLASLVTIIFRHGYLPLGGGYKCLVMQLQDLVVAFLFFYQVRTDTFSVGRAMPKRKHEILTPQVKHLWRVWLGSSHDDGGKRKRAVRQFPR